jgi:preprotein translocase subunit SecG
LVLGLLQYLHKGAFVNVLNIVLTIVLIVSALLTILLVLMHSGKGTGVSDMIASSMYNSSAGSAV